MKGKSEGSPARRPPGPPLLSGDEPSRGAVDAKRFDRQRRSGFHSMLRISLPLLVMVLVVGAVLDRPSIVPAVTFFLAVVGLCLWLIGAGRLGASVVVFVGTAAVTVLLRDLSDGMELAVRVWLLPLLLVPFLFYPGRGFLVPAALGLSVFLLYIVLATSTITTESLSRAPGLTEIGATVFLFMIGVFLRLQGRRVEAAFQESQLRLESQAVDLRLQRQRVEAALAETEAARQVLDDRVAERTADLQGALDELNRELAERRRVEEELRHAQRMESIGQLAGGVAHDFNNLLTLISGNLELALAACEGVSEKATARVRSALVAADRAGLVTGQLLAYSRREFGEDRIIEPGAVLDGVRSMIESTLGDRIELEVDVEDRAHLIRLGPGQLEQVLMNLVLNACEAMPDGGRLRVALFEVPEVEEGIGPPEHRGRRHVALTVSDSGAGMDEATRQRIFEPFFTTKARGRGTGLGLAVVHGIVSSHGGFIDVQSTPGRGSSFTVYFRAEAEPVEEARTAGGGHSGDTILVVDDEEPVCRLTVSLLEGLGYRVLWANSAEAALDVARTNATSIDLLLTDVVMPGFEGPELAEQFIEVHPNAAVLFVSGFTPPERFRALRLGSRRRFLQKPFSLDALSDEVESLIGPSARQ